MNALVVSRRALRWILPLLLLWPAGCASPKINWAARVGVYTYDQAVLELGPPDKQAKLGDGTIVAEWLTRRGYSQVYIPYGAGAPLWNYYPLYPVYNQTYVPDDYLRLVFGPDGRLKSWKNIVK
jgi:hypothetical protein